MRARNLKPGFFKNDLLAECDPLARILFQGLWCLADREGRLECRPKKIKAEILPYDNCKVIDLLEQLRAKGFIVVYKYDNQIYLEIPTFTEHQNCHIKEAESIIPAPCENDTCTVLVGPLTESLLLNPESPSPKPKRAKKVQGPLLRFDDFWKAYPKKKAIGDAEKAWGNINPSESLIEKILLAIEKGKTSEDWTKEGGKYIPHPATWLNRKGWEDEFKPANPLFQQQQPTQSEDPIEKAKRRMGL
jgi:hypothetical protein